MSQRVGMDVSSGKTARGGMPRTGSQGLETRIITIPGTAHTHYIVLTQQHNPTGAGPGAIVTLENARSPRQLFLSPSVHLSLRSSSRAQPLAPIATRGPTATKSRHQGRDRVIQYKPTTFGRSLVQPRHHTDPGQERESCQPPRETRHPRRRRLALHRSRGGGARDRVAKGGGREFGCGGSRR